MKWLGKCGINYDPIKANVAKYGHAGPNTVKGVGGPGVQIMENEFECLADKGDQDRHFAEKFVKKYCS